MHEEAIRKASVLIEALGYIRQFHGRFTVIKLGGSVMEDPESLRALLVDVVFMQTVGLRPVVVHGGGKAITAGDGEGRAGGRGSCRGGGTPTTATLEIVARVLAEEINADIVAAHQQVRRPGLRAAPQDDAPVPLRPSKLMPCPTGTAARSTWGGSAR